jgi:hypothetical protein
MKRPQLALVIAAGIALGAFVVFAIAGGVRGSRASGHLGVLDQRVSRIEVALGMADGGFVASADVPLAAADGGEADLASTDTPTPECAIAKIAAYHAWQDALTRAKSLAGPAQAVCSNLWSDRKKQACYWGATLEVRATQAARDTVVNGGPAAREALKNVKDDAKNDAIVRARAASDKAFAACGEDLE